MMAGVQRKLPKLVALPGGRPIGREDRRSSAELDLLPGGRSPRRRRTLSYEKVVDLLSHDEHRNHSLPTLERAIRDEVLSGSGRYRSKARLGGSTVSVERHGPEYFVTRRDAGNRVEYLTIEPSIKRTAKTFLVMWKHTPGQPLRL